MLDDHDYQGHLQSSSASRQQRPHQVVRLKKPKVAPRRLRQRSMRGLTDIERQLAIGSNESATPHPNYYYNSQYHDYRSSSSAAVDATLGGDAASATGSVQSSQSSIAEAQAAADGNGCSQQRVGGYQSTSLKHYQLGYSSSQAQLQSLNTSSPSFGSVGTLRKTPNRQQQQQPQLIQPFHLYRASQLSLASASAATAAGGTTLTTKPMTSIQQSPIMSATTEQPLSARQRPGSHPVGAASSTLATAYSGVQSGSPGASQQLPPPYDASVGSNGQQQHVICQQPVQQHQPCQFQANPAPDQVQVPSGSSLTAATAANRAHQHQQTANSSSLSGSSSFQINFLPRNQQQFPQFPALQLHQQVIEQNCQQTQQQHQLGVGLKSKSCLTCADISIKWYIVVIALLGLICALIGTIVGAVHSAGRDYISLGLLLIGVGLVLVAISWIALRITIKTYKTNTRPQQQQQLRTQQQLRGTPIGRIFPPNNQAAANRLYLMAAAVAARQSAVAAAAAAAAAAASQQREQQAAADSAGSGATAVNNNQLQQSGSGGFMNNIKQRFARFIPQSATESSTSACRSAPTNQPTEAGSQQQLLAEPQATLAALIHHYQTALIPNTTHPAAFLFPPSPSPHLLGFPLPGGPQDLQQTAYRPPPPSYSASMQDYRLRMLLQERAGLQQLNSMFPSANPPPPPPPPSQVTVLESEAERLRPIQSERDN